jgi:hypothetical protein
VRFHPEQGIVLNKRKHGIREENALACQERRIEGYVTKDKNIPVRSSRKPSSTSIQNVNTDRSLGLESSSGLQEE